MIIEFSFLLFVSVLCGVHIINDDDDDADPDSKDLTREKGKRGERERRDETGRDMSRFRKGDAHAGATQDGTKVQRPKQPVSIPLYTISIFVYTDRSPPSQGHVTREEARNREGLQRENMGK